MSYQLITSYVSNNCGYNPHYSHGGNSVKEIIIHHWGVDGQSFSNVCSWLCRKNGNSSAHYVVESGKVARLMPEKDCAWHAGNRYVNMHSIGIECRPEMSAGDLQTVIELVADIYRRYGVLPIRGHKDVASTDCPGRYYSHLSEIKAKATALAKGSAAAAATSTATAQHSGSDLVKTAQRAANYFVAARLDVDGIRGPLTNAGVIKCLQKAMNNDYASGLAVDGIYGPLTRKALGNHYVRRNERQYMVTFVEIALYALNYNPNGIEYPGEFGAGLEAAVRKFQGDNSLTVDGIVGYNTYRKLISKFV